VNTIVGPNNSGKSTIPEMIEFALYGAKALRDSAKGFITDGERDGSAIIQMNIGKHRYQIGRNSKDAELLKDGRDEASYKANVTKYVSALTGVSHGGFRLAHYVRQKELAAFSSLRPGKRQETVEKMLKINAVDRAIAVVKSQLDTSKALYDGFLRNVKDTEPEENELADLMLTHECTRQHPYELEPLELECSRTRDALRMADAIIARQDENGRIVERLLREAAELNLRLEKRPELEAQLKEVQEASAALGPISDEHLKELQVRLKELSDLELKDAEATEARKELALPPPDVMHAPIPVDSGPRDFAMAASATSRRAAESFKGLSGKSQCPTCLQPVEWKKEAQDVLDTAAKITAAEFDRLDIELTRAKREYQAQTRAHERYLQLIARRTLLVEQAMDTGYDPTAKVACALELEQCRNDREALARLQGKQNTTRVNLNRLEEDEARLASIATEIAAVEPEDPELVERQAQLADDCAAAEVEYKEMVELETVRRETLASLTGRIGELKAYVDGAAQVKALALTEAETLAMHQARQVQFSKFKRYITRSS
jgi:DNA repair exonuclease SbcCD ATPase subunit